MRATAISDTITASLAWWHGRFFSHLLPVIETFAARERARRGDRDGAMPVLREAVDDLFHAGQFWSCIVATANLVETLLERGTHGDVAEADAAVDRLATAPADDGLVMLDVWLVRMRALLARAQGHESGYRDYRDRYRDMARTLDFDGHVAWAQEMP